MNSAEIAERALRDISAIERRPYDFPADWSEQVKACPKCQSYKGHPIQQGICDEHRRPLWARDKHDEQEWRLLSARKLEIAQEALRSISQGEGSKQAPAPEGK